MNNKISVKEIDLCQMQIILPEKSTTVEKNAALELQDYLMKMCAVQIPIVNETEMASDVNSVYIGCTKFADSHHVTYPDNKFGEGWLIKAIGGNLVLCGGKTRGVLYAVYHLLEDVFGVHWWSMWDESIPKLDKAFVSADYADSGVPAMEYRDVFLWPVQPKNRFAVRNRLNGWALPIEKEFGGMECWGHPAHVHTFDRYFPAFGGNPGDVKTNWASAMNPEGESYFKTHPEWYGMTPRKRRVPKILCMSNEGLQKAFLEKLLKSIAFSYAEADAEGKPRPRYFNLSPPDMEGECQCPQCAESIRKHGSSGHQLRFVNKMAAEVKKVYPEAIVETIIYWHYLLPPLDDTRPSEDVLIRYCNNKMDILHDIHHPNNRQYLEGLNTWVNLCGKDNLYLWDYGVFFNANGIVPSMYKLSDNFRTFAQLGVKGYFLEIEQCITNDFWDMKVWLSTKLMENPNLDLDVLMDTFLSGYYGAAGPYIRRYLDAAHIRTEENGAYYSHGSTSLINADGFSVEDILFYNQCFEEAFTAADHDPILLRRLRDARMGLDRVIVENFAKWSKEAAEKNLEIPMDEVTVGRRLYQTFAEQVELRGEWDPSGEAAMKAYEKYLPDYVPTQTTPTIQSEEVRLSRLHGCKDGWKGNSPVIADQAELEIVPEDHLYVFTADIDFAGALAEDADSDLGVSACFNLAYKRKTHFLSEEVMYEKLAVADNDDEKCIPVGVYSGELDENGSPISAVWGTIRASDIIADGKYHLYKFPNVVAIAKDNGGAFHMFRDWSLQIYTMSWEMGFLAGKKMDCYISMKVTGNVSCTDPDNLPVYCIDKIIMADKNV